MDLRGVRETLEKSGVSFAAGLTEAEAAFAERLHGFRFPADLKEFLAFALPVSKGWSDWREPENPDLKKMFDWPYEGICFDVEQNGVWHADWGAKPASLAEAFSVVRQKVAAAPKLIPIYGHRYMPDRPVAGGNPVFSVQQADIVRYGANLRGYLVREFRVQFAQSERPPNESIREIEFWSALADAA